MAALEGGLFAIYAGPCIARIEVAVMVTVVFLIILLTPLLMRRALTSTSQTTIKTKGWSQMAGFS
jgi:hypothetical protein